MLKPPCHEPNIVLTKTSEQKSDKEPNYGNSKDDAGSNSNDKMVAGGRDDVENIICCQQVSTRRLDDTGAVVANTDITYPTIYSSCSLFPHPPPLFLNALSNTPKSFVRPKRDR